MKQTEMLRNEDIQRKWYVVDATDIALGRLASQVASVLKGKHNPFYTPHVDSGDYVIVINSDKIKLTGNKWNDKLYYRHSGYPGGLRTRNAKEVMDKFPTQMVEKAVKGMLPKTSLGRQMYRKLFVYASGDHPHEAQMPEVLEVK